MAADVCAEHILLLPARGAEAIVPKKEEARKEEAKKNEAKKSELKTVHHVPTLLEMTFFADRAHLVLGCDSVPLAWNNVHLPVRTSRSFDIAVYNADTDESLTYVLQPRGIEDVAAFRITHSRSVHDPHILDKKTKYKLLPLLLWKGYTVVRRVRIELRHLMFFACEFELRPRLVSGSHFQLDFGLKLSQRGGTAYLGGDASLCKVADDCKIMTFIEPRETQKLFSPPLIEPDHSSDDEIKSIVAEEVTTHFSISHKALQFELDMANLTFRAGDGNVSHIHLHTEKMPLKDTEAKSSVDDPPDSSGWFRLDFGRVRISSLHQQVRGESKDASIVNSAHLAYSIDMPPRMVVTPTLAPLVLYSIVAFTLKRAIMREILRWTMDNYYISQLNLWKKQDGPFVVMLEKPPEGIWGHSLCQAVRKKAPASKSGEKKTEKKAKKSESKQHENTIYWTIYNADLHPKQVFLPCPLFFCKADTMETDMGTEATVPGRGKKKYAAIHFSDVADFSAFYNPVSD